MFIEPWKYFVGMKKIEILRWNPDEDKKNREKVRSNILIEKQNYKPKGVGITGVEIQTQK